MCGIVGYIGVREAAPVIVDGLRKLEYRGYDSAGVALFSNASPSMYEGFGETLQLGRGYPHQPTLWYCGIGHTRWATHGTPTEENAHPRRDCTGNIVVVHNGIVDNYLQLRKDLTAEGHIFKTETDTEVLAHLVEKYLSGASLEAAVRKL
ncbi:MAG: hypothetical protein ACJ746_17175 [Bryobacteraceae bacterium]